MKRAYGLGLVFVVGLSLLVGCVTPPDPTPPAVETGLWPARWTEIPAGAFFQGQHEHKTLIGIPYEMMITDVTNAQYARFVNEALVADYVEIDAGSVVGFYPGDAFHGGAHERRIAAGPQAFLPTEDPALRLTFDGELFGVKRGYGDHPMTMVSWFGAWGYCDFHGWHLPSDAEWEKAARGTDNRPFPWGDEIPTDHANFISSHDPFEQIFGRAGGTTPVGFYDGQSHGGYATLDGRSPYGLFDMAGNVWQWTGDVREGTHYRGLRGGGHTSYAYELRIWSHNNADPTHTSPTVGFRCARTVE